ncbi:aspartyl/glutamyl-tRNA(Asn/Gln) amidotransferase subunit B-like isoform X2 [Gordionus sp. m RMFG-2023]|uniref:aspartyl/glutamyl-tRNA(Asn/Gln) amidotransferase subunit B-like isoform X2 n=1 Tax=Gordionus sp. m RMFG-2023 TaxID=3053472 RepID=UPI0031FD06B9
MYVFYPNTLLNRSFFDKCLQRLSYMLHDELLCWDIRIGLEIHIKLLNLAKIFSNSSANFVQIPNHHVTPVDIGFPGTLPLVNINSIKKALTLAKILDCHINFSSTFDRKHYIYPDLAQGYQITQKTPLAQNGYLEYIKWNPAHQTKAEYRKVKIQKIHIENDSGKSIYGHKNSRLIDFNRSGVGLLELVTEPTFNDSEDCASFLRELIEKLTNAGLNDGRLDRGSLRVDANLHVYPIFNNNNRNNIIPRCEIKNMNSVKHLVNAIEYEIKRYKLNYEEIIEKTNLQFETRSYNSNTGKTYATRVKKNFLGYRYIPEYNIPNLILTQQLLNSPNVNYDDKNRELYYDISSSDAARIYNMKFGLTLDKSLNLARDKDLSRVFLRANQMAKSFFALKAPVFLYSDNSIYINPHHLYSIITTTLKSYLNDDSSIISFEDNAKSSTISLFERNIVKNSITLSELSITLIFLLELILSKYLENKKTDNENGIFKKNVLAWILLNNLIQNTNAPMIRQSVNDYLKINSKVKLNKAEFKKKATLYINKKHNGTLNPTVLNYMIDDVFASN